MFGYESQVGLKIVVVRERAFFSLVRGFGGIVMWKFERRREELNGGFGFFVGLF